MYKFTNKYIIIYSIIMVAIVAVLLTLGATALKPLQDKNKKNEKIGYILRASRQEFDPKNAEDTYKKLLIKEIAINESGDIIAEFDYINCLRGKLRPFDIDVNTETKNSKKANHIFCQYIYTKQWRYSYSDTILWYGTLGSYLGLCSLRK